MFPLLFPSAADVAPEGPDQHRDKPSLIALPKTTVTVHATPGLAEKASEAAPASAAISFDSSPGRPLPVVGNALAGESGILAQQSTAAQSSDRKSVV